MRILGDKPSLLKVGASFLGFAGVALAARTGTINWAVDLLAIILLVISGFAWATDTVLFKRLFKGEQLLRANVWQLAGASVFLLIWALISEPVQEIKMDLAARRFCCMGRSLGNCSGVRHKVHPSFTIQCGVVYRIHVCSRISCSRSFVFDLW
jgi:EamA-like transporter family